MSAAPGLAAMVPTYRQRPSPLHAARAGATAALCGAFALVCSLYESPLVLAAVIAAVVGLGVAAGVSRELGRTALLSVPLALLVIIINPLIYRDGDTLLVRGGEVLGRRFDITLEALAAGGLAGMRVVAFVMAFGLFSACVDPDDMLRLFRRFSYRSALSAALATRLVPVLARDAMRMGEAVRCRPRPPARLAVARAALAGALDRGVEVAAALEVRGYSAAAKPAADHPPWSRHDLRVTAAALLVAAAAVAFATAGTGAVEAYPSLEIAAGPSVLALCSVLLAAAALPFAGRSSRLGVARA